MVKRFTYNKISKRSPKKYWRHTPSQVFLQIKLVGGATNKFNFLANISCIATQQLAGFSTIQPLDLNIFGNCVPLALLINMDSVSVKVVYTNKIFASPKRPVNGGSGDFEHLFYFIK